MNRTYVFFATSITWHPSEDLRIEDEHLGKVVAKTNENYEGAKYIIQAHRAQVDRNGGCIRGGVTMGYEQRAREIQSLLGVDANGCLLE